MALEHVSTPQASRFPVTPSGDACTASQKPVCRRRWGGPAGRVKDDDSDELVELDKALFMAEAAGGDGTAATLSGQPSRAQILDPDPGEPEPAEPAEPAEPVADPQQCQTSAYNERLQWSTRLLLASKDTDVSESEDEAETPANPQLNNLAPPPPHPLPPPALSASRAPHPDFPHSVHTDGCRYVLWICRRAYPACDGPAMMLKIQQQGQLAVAREHALALCEQNFQTAIAVWVWTNHDPHTGWESNRLTAGRRSGRPAQQQTTPCWVPLHGPWCIADTASQSSGLCINVPCIQELGRTHHPRSSDPGQRRDGLRWPTPDMVKNGVAAWDMCTNDAALVRIEERHGTTHAANDACFFACNLH